ncbi:hypothetical protein [Paenibacillus sp. YIM B09110]|uniref:hypothetical protein n=1 Tax=Paenibacillus sp. YIM B09110 TaxID=3126102 RepID=UPI00301D5EBF
MRKQGRTIFLWMNYVLFGICVLFYIVLLRAPITFLEGAAVGLFAYGVCFGLIRIGWYRFVKGVLLAMLFALLALALYALGYVLVHSGQLSH